MEARDNIRIDTAIEKLTDVSSDLKKMLAVHEQRIDVLEKYSDKTNYELERRRTEINTQVDQLYETIHREDSTVLDKLDKIKLQLISQYDSLSDKVKSIEKTIWLYIGGLSVLIMLFANDGSPIKKVVTTLFTFATK
jgi:DNA anti-recombination protein RmuC